MAAEPKRQLLTGVTMGPEMTIETSASATWLVDWPHTCRTRLYVQAKTVHVALGQVATTGVEREFAGAGQQVLFVEEFVACIRFNEGRAQRCSSARHP